MNQFIRQLRNLWQGGSLFLITLGLLSWLGLLSGLTIKILAYWTGTPEPDWNNQQIVLSFCGTWIAPTLWVCLGVFTHQITPSNTNQPHQF